MNRKIRSILTSSLCLAISSVGCSKFPPTAIEIGSPAISNTEHASHGSIEDAALQALARARRSAKPSQRLSISVGAIVKTTEGYEAAPPHYSASLLGRSTVRLLVRRSANEVARYLVYPKTGHAEIDRANRRLSERLKSGLLESDPERRPIYILNSRDEVLRYESSGPEVSLGAIDSLLREQGPESAEGSLANR